MSMFDIDRSYIFQQIRILDPASKTNRVGDVWIERGKLQAIEDRIESIPDGAEPVDAQGWVMGPGLIDLYAQSGEPGFEQRETLHSLANAALAGGFTQVGLLPTTDPVVDTPDAIQAILDHRASNGPPHWLPFAAMTHGTRGESLTELAELVDSGAIAFCDNRPIDSLPLLRRMLEYAHPLKIPILLWPQATSLAGGGMLEGQWSIRAGVKGSCTAAEPLAVAQIIELVALTETPVHLMRLSQARSVALVRQAQSTALPITASTTWMHLLFADRDIETYHYHPALHLHVPLGSDSDRQALVDAVQDGTLSAIATDHTPYTFEEKTVAFAEAPAGAIGLELALPLLWQRLVMEGGISSVELWSVLSQKPAAILRLPSPTLAIGESANCTIFVPDRSWTLNRQSAYSLSTATPYWNQEIKGQVIACWSNGRCWNRLS